jgi:hypothetical protein
MIFVFGINAQPNTAEAYFDATEMPDMLKGKYPPKEYGQTLSNDSAYFERKLEVANLKSLERRFQCTIQKYPFGFDETTGLKMLYIKTNESPYNVSNGVDNITCYLIDPGDFWQDLHNFEHIKTTAVAGVDILKEKLALL